MSNDDLKCTRCGGPLDPGQFIPGLCCGCGMDPDITSLDTQAELTDLVIQQNTKARMCGCGYVHEPHERCGPW